ncbi:MAG: hypothetical protein Q7V19_17440, partial [Bacteroidales bacterium]|nr:hypothetical protein [Bacteroidales bacterium]
MIRRFLAYGLLLLQLTMIILPEVPYLVYLHQHGVRHIRIDDSCSFSNEKPLVGDITYLKALIDRALESADNTEKQKLPERHVNTGSLVYLVNESYDNTTIFCQAEKDYNLKT